MQWLSFRSRILLFVDSFWTFSRFVNARAVFVFRKKNVPLLSKENQQNAALISGEGPEGWPAGKGARPIFSRLVRHSPKTCGEFMHFAAVTCICLSHNTMDVASDK